MDNVFEAGGEGEPELMEYPGLATCLAVQLVAAMDVHGDGSWWATQGDVIAPESDSQGDQRDNQDSTRDKKPSSPHGLIRLAFSSSCARFAHPLICGVDTSFAVKSESEQTHRQFFGASCGD